MRPPLRPGAPGLAGANGAGKPKKGICTCDNYINPDTGETEKCPNCESGRVLTVNVNGGMGFNCPICHSKLTAVKGGGRKGLIIGAIAAVLAIAGGTAWYLTNNSDNKPTEQTEQPGPTNGSKDTDTTSTTNGGGSTTGPETGPTPPPPYPKQVIGGKAIQVNSTTLKFQKTYYLDLGGYGSKLKIEPGDEIRDADIHNGVLYGGKFVDCHRLNGVQVLVGLNIQL